MANLEQRIEEAGLSRLKSQIVNAASPGIGFVLEDAGEVAPGPSKFGGGPDLPKDFDWPTNKERPLDFLLQVNLAEISEFNVHRQLPAEGLLSFFYDMEEQPWGYDPKDLDGFRVVYTPASTPLRKYAVSDKRPDFTLPERSLKFHAMTTLPSFGSRANEQLEQESELSDEESDAYYELVSQIEHEGRPDEDSGNHHLLGHSANIQGDMQLEAQLVTNGLYCGDPSGYEDPRAQALETGADDWRLLLQLDSDDSIEIMWGDCGMLYWWIREEDLKQLRFERVWMSQQCY